MIPSYLIDRIANSETTGGQLAALFSGMADAVEKLRLPGSTLTLEFAQEGDPIRPGDLIPQIHLTLRPARITDVATEETRQENPQETRQDAPETEG